MQYFAIQVSAGREDNFIERASKDLAEFDIDIFTPKRKLKIRKAGVCKKKVSPVFSGYVFLAVEDFSAKLQRKLRTVNNFIRILPNSSEPIALKDDDLELIKHFIKFGNFADISKATFDENDRIVILDGFLKGFEGKIIKVDKRKGRAKVLLDMYQNGFTIDFGFETIGSK